MKRQQLLLSDNNIVLKKLEKKDNCNADNCSR